MHVNLEELEQFAHGDQAFILRMLESCLASTPGLVEKLQNALAANDRETVKATAHRLRPVFQYLGRADLSTQLEELENSALSSPAETLTQKSEAFAAEAKKVLVDVEQLLQQLKQ